MESFKEFKNRIKKSQVNYTSPWYARRVIRKFSPYITKVLVTRTNVSANQVTIWQFIASLMGLGLLCFASPWIAFSGALLLHLGYIFDNVDGEVARYRKSQSINGMFLDFVNHEIIIPMIFGCLSFHYYFLTQSPFCFALGISIILFESGPVGHARFTTIRFLIKKRLSPTYDVRNYQIKDRAIKHTASENSKTSTGTKDFIRKLRKNINGAFAYPNDIIIISALLIVELIWSKPIIGIVFMASYLVYLAGNFLLDIYIHLKRRIPERDFYNYIEACSEIKATLDR